MKRQLDVFSGLIAIKPTHVEMLQTKDLKSLTNTKEEFFKNIVRLPQMENNFV